MPTPINIPFPRYGIRRTFERSVPNETPQGYYANLHPESCYNAVNVVPYDRFDRLRGGPRPGTSNQFGGPIDGGPVTAMCQTVTYKPNPPITLIADNFAPGGGGGWTAGQALEQHGSWTVFQSSTGTGGNPAIEDAMLEATAVTPSDTKIVASTGVTYFKRGTFNQSIAAYRNVPSTYADNYTINVTSFGGAVTGRNRFVFLRYDPTNPTACIGLYLFFFNTGAIPTCIISPETLDGSPISGGGAITWGNTSENFAITVSGNSITISAGGSPDPGGTPASFSFVCPTGAGHLGVGFGFTNNPATPFDPILSFTVQSNPNPTRQTNIIAVAASHLFSAQDVFVGTIAGIAKAASGTGVVASGVIPQMCYVASQAYLVDGSNLLQVDVPNSTMVAYSTTAGTAPASTAVCCNWRDRLVLANTPAGPQNFYFSRVGVPTDWDYSQTDPAAAFAGNASVSGHIGDPILALMPFTDDQLLIGCDRSIWMMNGDPADGGSITLVSDTIGIVGANAWTKDPHGAIWFFGTGGLYRIQPGGKPENMTAQSWNVPFIQITRSANYYNLLWDRDRQGLEIFVTPRDASLIGQHYWYDHRNQGLWTWIFPSTYGPVSAMIYDGDAQANRVTLLGAFDGNVYALSSNSPDDNGIQFGTLMTLGPFQPGGPGMDAVVTGLDVTLAENFGGNASTAINTTWTLKAGKSAFEVTEGTPRRTSAGTFSYPGRQLTRHPRLRGGWFGLEFSNNTDGQYWGLEQVVLHVEQGGKQR